MGRGRLEHLDGLRGWAALVVVIFHFRTNLGIPLLAHSGDPVASASAWASAALFFLQDGSLAVAIFFILSGIVLATAVDGAASRAHLQTGLSGSPSLPPSFLGLVVTCASPSRSSPPSSSPTWPSRSSGPAPTTSAWPR